MNKLNENTNFLKLVGILTMLIDHIGCILFPKILLFRVIGRIAFPIFTYTTYLGYKHTKNLKKYILRLFIIGIISQPIYMLSFNRLNPNIMFTLIFELFLYYCLDKKKWWYIPFIIIFSFVLNLEYSIVYMFLVPMFYYFSNNSFIITIYTFTFYFNYAIDSTIYLSGIPACLTSAAILFLPFVIIKNDVKVEINKYFFYLFYPIHLLTLFLIKSIM